MSFANYQRNRPVEAAWIEYHADHDRLARELRDFADAYGFLTDAQERDLRQRMAADQGQRS